MAACSGRVRTRVVRVPFEGEVQQVTAERDTECVDQLLVIAENRILRRFVRIVNRFSGEHAAAVRFAFGELP